MTNGRDRVGKKIYKEVSQKKRKKKKTRKKKRAFGCLADILRDINGPHEQTKDAASDPVAAVFQRLIIQEVSHGQTGVAASGLPNNFKLFTGVLHKYCTINRLAV